MPLTTTVGSDSPAPRRLPPPRRRRDGAGTLGLNMPLRFPYVAPTATPDIVVSVGGVVRSGTSAFLELGSIKIKDNLNEQPNTCSCVARGFTPTYGQEVLIGLGSLDPNVLLFGGYITDLSEGYDLIPGATLNVFWQLTCMDYMWQLNRRRPIINFVSQPAEQIIATLMSSWGAGFTLSCPTGLPSIAIAFNGSKSFAQCLTDVTNAIGYHWKVNYARQVRIFTTDTGTAPTTIDLTNTVTQAQPSLTYEINVDQIRNLVTGYGIQTQLLGDVLAGETILPINSTVGFEASGGQSLVGFINNIYTGIQVGGVGVFVGPGVTPTSAPSVTGNGAGVLGTGTYQWAFTYVTAAGESLPSPITVGVTHAGLADPGARTSAFSGNHASAAGSCTLGIHGYAVTYVDAFGGETLPSIVDNPGGPVGVFSGVSQHLSFDINAGPPGTVARKLYFTTSQASIAAACAATLFFAVLVNDNTTLLNTILDMPDSSLGAAAPTVNTTNANQMLIGISAGPATVTSRKIYRTVVGGSQLKLAVTVGDNTTLSTADNVADGSLGANAPSTDTSGLTQPNGQVLMGSSTLVVAGTTPFVSTGGWGRIGSIVFRYSGISGNLLTGIPTSGPGSLTASVGYGSTVIAAPALTGVTGIVTPQTANIVVAIRYTQADPTSQALMAAAEGGDGVHEYVFYNNNDLSVAALISEVQANLILYAYPIVSLQASSRDINDISGRAITVNLPAPMSISVVVLIQSVDITHIGTEQNAFPLYTARASSVKFTLQDLIRQLGGLLSA